MKRSIAALALVVTALAQPAMAQDRPKAALEFAGGALYFPDDAGVTEGNDFYLSTGGDAKRSRELRSMMQRKLISAQPPEFPAELNDTK